MLEKPASTLTEALLDLSIAVDLPLADGGKIVASLPCLGTHNAPLGQGLLSTGWLVERSKSHGVQTNS